MLKSSHVKSPTPPGGYYLMGTESHFIGEGSGRGVQWLLQHTQPEVTTVQDWRPGPSVSLNPDVEAFLPS